MVHWSENSTSLRIAYNVTRNKEALNAQSQSAEVCIVVLPSHPPTHKVRGLRDLLTDFPANLSPNATLIVLGEVTDLVHIHPIISRSMRYQLWISIKSSVISSTTPQCLPSQHFGAIVYTRYKSSLIHCRTRIKYTYCPACDKTTKDYGGKKHTYHEYGTLISDVWRDIQCSLDGDLHPIFSRLADLFGTPNYRELRILDCRSLPIIPNMATANYREDSVVSSNHLPESLKNSLLQGDCLTRLHELPDSSVDFVFADPPYNLRKQYTGYADDLQVTEYFNWCDEWINELARVLRPGRTCAVLNIPLWAIRHFLHMETVLTFQNWIAWDALAFPVRLIMPSHYALLCFTKGESRNLPGLNQEQHSDSISREFLEPLAEGYCLRSDCIKQRKLTHVSDRAPLTDVWWDIHRLKHNTRRVDHPCQLPPNLMRRLVSLFTLPGEVVLDCFNGAGTTTLAAAQLQRNYVGIELSDEYHNLALSRHRELSNGLDPFRKANRVLKAKNSPVPRMPKQRYIVSKKTLQLEIKRIARLIGKLPDRKEVARYSKYPLEYYERYFASWGEVCAAARTTGMSETRVPPESSVPAPQLRLF